MYKMVDVVKHQSISWTLLKRKKVFAKVQKSFSFKAKLFFMKPTMLAKRKVFDVIDFQVGLPYVLPEEMSAQAGVEEEEEKEQHRLVVTSPCSSCESPVSSEQNQDEEEAEEEEDTSSDDSLLEEDSLAGSLKTGE